MWGGVCGEGCGGRGVGEGCGGDTVEREGKVEEGICGMGEERNKRKGIDEERNTSGNISHGGGEWEGNKGRGVRGGGEEERNSTTSFLVSSR